MVSQVVPPGEAPRVFDSICTVNPPFESAIVHKQFQLGWTWFNIQFEIKFSKKVKIILKKRGSRDWGVPSRDWGVADSLHTQYIRTQSVKVLGLGFGVTLNLILIKYTAGGFPS